MDGVGRAVSAPTPIEVGGTLWLASPLRLKDFGIIENHLLNTRPSMLRTALRNVRNLPHEVAELAIVVANEEDERAPNHIRPQELQSYLTTRDGCVMALWLMLRHNHEVTFERVDGLVSHDPNELADLISQQNLANGMTKLAERDWSAGWDDEDDEPESADADPKRFNWKYAIRKVCEAYLGLTPEAVGNMSLYTFRMLYLDAGNVKGRRIPYEQWLTRERAKLAKQQEARQ